MPNNIVKLPDNDGNMRFNSFCPSCHYWFFAEHYGDKYCPHCGVLINWNSEKANLYHEISYEFSLEKYKACKEATYNAE